MKVLILINDIHQRSGAPTSVRRICKNLSAIGYEGVIISNKILNCSYEKIKKIGSFSIEYVGPRLKDSLVHPIISNIFINFSILLARIGRSIYKVFKIIEILRKRDIYVIFVVDPSPLYDLTLFFLIFLNILHLLMLKKHLLGFRTVFNIRGIYSLFVPLSISLNGMRWLLKRTIYMNEIIMMHFCDKIVYVDDHMKSYFPRVVSRKARVIPNSVDINMFCPGQVKDDGRTITYVYGLLYVRGIYVFLEAMELLKGRDYKFIITGDGLLESQVKEYIKNRNMDVVFTGTVTSREMAELMNKSTIVVNPMLVKGIGNVTIEAMACGKAVGKSDYTNGHDPIITDGFNGILFRGGDPADLVDKINYLMKNPKIREELGTNARRTIIEKFTQEQETKRYDKLFKSL